MAIAKICGEVIVHRSHTARSSLAVNENTRYRWSM